MTTTTVVPNKRLTNSPIYLPVGQTSGSFKIAIPFMAEYIMILNDTVATIAVCIGDQSSQGPEAQLWTPGKYISMPLIQETQKLTVFWTSQQPIPADNNLLQFYFSNVTIPLQGGSYGTASESQNVDVMNTVTVQFGATQNVNVSTMPSIPGGTSNIGRVNIDQMPSIPAGPNVIGKVDLNNTGNLKQSLTTGPVSSNQITTGTTAIALATGVVNGKKVKIKNLDATNAIFIGSSGVTGTNGFELGSKETIDFDIVPGSTINIYGIATAGTPIAAVLILN